MRSNDLIEKTRKEISSKMQKALAENDTNAFTEAFGEMLGQIEQSIRQDYAELAGEIDTNVLAARGVRQLTSEEKKYYQKLADAMRSDNPKQALTSADLTFPETIINNVFDDLQTNHELLSHIDFMPSSGAVKMLYSDNDYQEAAWGALCNKIVKEILAGFKEVDTGLLKLSAFLPVCKAMLDLGPEWLDNFVRQVLYEALANGLEAGIVKGDGNGKPIGMNRQVGDSVSVVGGVYPEKEKIVVNSLDAETIGKLLAKMAVSDNGRARNVNDVILIVNPVDYLEKVMPATTVMAPDGTYRNNVLPYPATIIQSAALESGEAILGMGGKYFAAAGMEKEGRIEYSDQYQFLEDNRVYLIKLYANGFPKGNNDFLLLNIAGLQPASYKVKVVNEAAK